MECRKFLDVHYPMAVEFRSRVWFSAENLPVSLDWLKQHNIGGYTHFYTQVHTSLRREEQEENKCHV